MNQMPRPLHTINWTKNNILKAQNQNKGSKKNTISDTIAHQLQSKMERHLFFIMARDKGTAFKCHCSNENAVIRECGETEKSWRENVINFPAIICCHYVELKWDISMFVFFCIYHSLYLLQLQYVYKSVLNSPFFLKCIYNKENSIIQVSYIIY